MPRMHRRDRRPTPVVSLVAPVLLEVAPVLPEPDLEGPILADQELEDAHRFSVEEAYRLASRAWGTEFGVAWAAYVAGLPIGSFKWTMPQIRMALFLRWLHRQGRG